MTSDGWDTWRSGAPVRFINQNFRQRVASCFPIHTSRFPASSRTLTRTLSNSSHAPMAIVYVTLRSAHRLVERSKSRAWCRGAYTASVALGDRTRLASCEGAWSVSFVDDDARVSVSSWISACGELLRPIPRGAQRRLSRVVNLVARAFTCSWYARCHQVALGSRLRRRPADAG